MRRAANVMIAAALLGLVAIVLYFVGTWLYTARQQDALRDQLAADNPDLARAEQAVSESDFVTIGDLAAQAVEAERRSAAGGSQGGGRRVPGRRSGATWAGLIGG